MPAKQDYSSLAKALEEQRELKMEYKETRSNEYGIFIDRWIDVIKRNLQKFAKVIRSEANPNIGIVVQFGETLLSIKGIAGFSDEDLNAIEFRVTPGDGPTKVNIYYPSSDTGTSPGTLQGTTKPVKEKPDQNYLKLRKSKY